jgi:transcriptional regulator with XRE-family HTH domain
MKSHPDNEFGGLIRDRFRKSGLSIKALADRAGVPYAAAHGFLTGTRDPALSTATKLCKILRLELRPVRATKRK